MRRQKKLLTKYNVDLNLLPAELQDEVKGDFFSIIKGLSTFEGIFGSNAKA
jgi:hypothetical protein